MNYSPSSCGLFGILKKDGSNKINGSKVAKSLDIIKYRGSNKGSGYASFNLNQNNYYSVKTFYRGSEDELKRIFKDKNMEVSDCLVEDAGNIKSYCFNVSLDNINNIDEINDNLWLDNKGRVYSVGKSLNVFKGVGYPLDVAEQYSIYGKYADMWLAHTRQPTNSPGNYPYWSHPFSSFNIAIVHNGDISSFGSNREYLKSLGIKSFVGTDSEVIAYLFRELLKKFDITETVKILSNSIDDPKIKYRYRGSVLDGPYTLVIGYEADDDLYMMCLTDSTKLRPVILGEDDNNYYIASEENQIRLINENAKVWSMEPGSYFIVSMKKGIISSGRQNRDEGTTYTPEKYDIDALEIDYNKLDQNILNTGKDHVTVKNVFGHRYIGMEFPDKRKTLDLYGYCGNCLMNLNINNHVNVYGNVADDCCDGMIGGKVVIHGNAGDVLAQAFQNGRIYVNGNVGNRAGLQMRSYSNFKPYLIINGGFDDYLGEYMSGGVILSFSNTEQIDGKYIGSGMIGGKIIIRGNVNKNKIGIQTDRIINKNILRSLYNESLIDEEFYSEMKDKSIVDILENMPEEGRKYTDKLFNKHEIPFYEYRYLNKDEQNELEEIVRDFDTEMGTDNIKYLHNKFTIITAEK